MAAWTQQGEATLSKRVWVIKYEWEWAVFTCKLWASVCHVYQTAAARERGRGRGDTWRTLKCKQAPQALSVIDALMGVGGGRWHWTEGGRVQTGTSKACWTLINKCALIRHKKDGGDERSANAPPPPPPSSMHFCSISSRPEEPGCHRTRHSIQRGGGSMSS